MCEMTTIMVGLSIASAASSVAAQQQAAKARNKAARDNARSIIEQASSQQSAAMAKIALEASNAARQEMARGVEEERGVAKLVTEYADLGGNNTPFNEAQTEFFRAARDGEWALNMTKKTRRLEHQDLQSSIFRRELSGISMLPTSSRAGQFFGAAATITGAARDAYVTSQKLKSPSNESLVTDADTSDVIAEITDARGLDQQWLGHSTTA